MWRRLSNQWKAHDTLHHMHMTLLSTRSLFSRSLVHRHKCADSLPACIRSLFPRFTRRFWLHSRIRRWCTQWTPHVSLWGRCPLCTGEIQPRPWASSQEKRPALIYSRVACIASAVGDLFVKGMCACVGGCVCVCVCVCVCMCGAKCLWKIKSQLTGNVCCWGGTKWTSAGSL